MKQILQAALKTVFPDHCLLCGDLTDEMHGLCGPCWRDTPFLLTPGCKLCGAPLLGSDGGDGAICEDCRETMPPWDAGTTVMLYEGAARRLAMAIKHGDRSDLVSPLAQWMAPKARPLVETGMIVVPVPIHWRRLLLRRHNQAAGLARHLAKELGLPCLPDALRRCQATSQQKKMTKAERFAQQSNSIAPTPLWQHQLKGRAVLLVDDVMTTGATLAACANACHAAGARRVCVVTLARAVRTP